MKKKTSTETKTCGKRTCCASRALPHPALPPAPVNLARSSTWTTQREELLIPCKTKGKGKWKNKRGKCLSCSSSQENAFSFSFLSRENSCARVATDIKVWYDGAHVHASTHRHTLHTHKHMYVLALSYGCCIIRQTVEQFVKFVTLINTERERDRERDSMLCRWLKCGNVAFSL